MRRHRSLYGHLFTLFGLTFALLAVTLWTTFALAQGSNREPTYLVNLDHYAQLLAEEIGVPPDPARLKALSSRLDLDIWATGPGAQTPTQQGPRWHRGFQTTRDGWTFTFRTRRSPVSSGAALAALAAAACVLGGSWWALRRLLAPLRSLSQAVSGLGVTAWNARIPERGAGELGDLARTFNAMADRVSAHWESQRALLTAVSHELRSPLTRMRVALEFLPQGPIRSGLEDDILRLDRVTAILLERERLTLRPDLLRRERVQWGAWLEAELEPFRHSGLDVTASGPDAQVEWDTVRGTLVVSNLMENVRRHAPGAKCAWSWFTEGAELVITLTDEGPGLPPEALAQWGEPFAVADQAHPARQAGFGLGSSLVKTILEAHGGSARVESCQGSGLTVTLRLPTA